MKLESTIEGTHIAISTSYICKYNIAIYGHMDQQTDRQNSHTSRS